MEDRIAALRQARQATLDKNVTTEEPTQDMTAAAVEPSTGINHDSNIDNKVEAHLTTTTTTAADESSYPEEMADPNTHEEIPYPIAAADAYPVENHPDIPYPVEDEDAYYPDDNADIPYPVEEDAYPDDNGEIPYPMNEEEDAYYPVNEEYPVTDAYEEEDGQEDVPAVAPYPTTDGAPYDAVGAYPVVSRTHHTNANASDNKGAPALVQKKVFTGDKAIVGFVPSHLQVKRMKPKPKPKFKRGGTMPTRTIVVVVDDKDNDKTTQNTPGPTTTKTTTTTAPSNSVADDYDKFMQEISALK